MTASKILFDVLNAIGVKTDNFKYISLPSNVLHICCMVLQEVSTDPFKYISLLKKFVHIFCMVVRLIHQTKVNRKHYNK